MGEGEDDLEAAGRREYGEEDGVEGMQAYFDRSSNSDEDSDEDDPDKDI